MMTFIDQALRDRLKRDCDALVGAAFEVPRPARSAEYSPRLRDDPPACDVVVAFFDAEQPPNF